MSDRRLSFGFALATCLGLSACGDGPPANVSERLWVSGVPTDTREEIDAFVVTDVRGRSIGAFYRGSAYRGRHELFTWKARGERKGQIRMLHDQTTHPITVHKCEARAGFDYCIELRGDPTGVETYYSRKRWAVPKKGRGKALEVDDLAADLAAEDPELAVLGGLAE